MARHFFEQLSGIVDSTNTCPRILVAHRRDRQLSWTDESPPPPGCIDAARICTASTCALRQTHRRYPTYGCLAAHRICAAPRPTPPVLGQHAARARCWLDETETKKRPYETNAEQSPASLSLSLSYTI
jgi:hypothetical protein